MAKSIIKEIFIILLLVVAILLILGIVFYDYFPTNAKVPSKVAEYALTEEMEVELSETLEAAETQNIVKTYRVDSSELQWYIETSDYEQGKINPFESIVTSDEETDSEETYSDTNSDGSDSSSNSLTDSNGSSDDGTQVSTGGNFLNEVK